MGIPIVKYKIIKNSMMIWENKQKLVSNQAAMSYNNGKLMINGKEYDSQVKTPTVRKILTLALNGMS